MAAPNSAIQTNYAENADEYEQFLRLPMGMMEKQLLDLAIVNCAGYRVLDLGGGTGLRAREALAAGAASVDVVDISEDMMRQGQQQKGTNPQHDAHIRWFPGDASQSLAHLPLLEYDMVIANGIFDHAHSVDELETMWRNTATYLKPGGRLIANRNCPTSKCADGASPGGGKYGVVFTDFAEIPGGTTFRYRMASDPPLVFESTALDVYASGSNEVPGRYFEEFRNIPWQDTPLVREDLDFWADYLADPILYIFTARKKLE